jgi:hypothetical protein
MLCALPVGHVVPDTEAEEAKKKAREEAERVVTTVLDVHVDLRSKQHASLLCKGLEGGGTTPGRAAERGLFDRPGMGCKSIQEALGLEENVATEISRNMTRERR